MDPIEEKIKQDLREETEVIINSIHSQCLNHNADACVLACLSYTHTMLKPSPEKDRVEALIEHLVPFALGKRYNNEIEKN